MSFIIQDVDGIHSGLQAATLIPINAQDLRIRVHFVHLSLRLDCTRLVHASLVRSSLVPCRRHATSSMPLQMVQTKCPAYCSH